MRKLIATLISLAFAPVLFGQAVVVKHKAAATCSTVRDNTFTTAPSGADQTLGRSADIMALATVFTAGSSYTMCSVTAALKATGSPTFNIAAAIFTNSGSGPGSLVGIASSPKSVSGMSSSYASFNFTGMSAPLVSGNSYFLVIYYTSGTTNYYVDYISQDVAAGVSANHRYYSPALTPWTDDGGYILADFTGYSN